jgi:hypothetical protein
MNQYSTVKPLYPGAFPPPTPDEDAGHEGLAQTQARAVQKTAILPHGM